MQNLNSEKRPRVVSQLFKSMFVVYRPYHLARLIPCQVKTFARVFSLSEVTFSKAIACLLSLLRSVLFVRVVRRVVRVLVLPTSPRAHEDRHFSPRARAAAQVLEHKAAGLTPRRSALQQIRSFSRAQPNSPVGLATIRQADVSPLAQGPGERLIQTSLLELGNGSMRQGALLFSHSTVPGRSALSAAE